MYAPTVHIVLYIPKATSHQLQLIFTPRQRSFSFPYKLLIRYEVNGISFLFTNACVLVIEAKLQKRAQAPCRFITAERSLIRENLRN